MNHCTTQDFMEHENKNVANLHTGLKRREFMAMLAGCTAGLMVPSIFHGQGNAFAATGPHSDRLGELLPLRKLGSSGPAVTSLGVGGDHVGSASQMPVNPAAPHFVSFVTHVVAKCVEAGIGVLAMKTLAYGRFFGGNKGWRCTEVSVKPAIPAVLSVEDAFGFVWSLPITTLVSGMESVQQVSQNAAISRKTWNWNQAERQKRIDVMVPFAGPDLEFYKN
jgi:hypothetical protein